MGGGRLKMEKKSVEGSLRKGVTFASEKGDIIIGCRRGNSGVPFSNSSKETKHG